MLHIEVLTDDQQHAHICRDYWRQDEKGEYAFKIREVAERHGMMPQSVSKFVNKYAYVWVSDISCARCGEPYIFSTRTQYQERRTLRNRVCAACLAAEQKAIEEKKNTLIREFNQASENTNIDLDNRDITSQVYLLSALQALGNEKLTTIYPLSKFPACTLSPDPAYDKKILSYLIDRHILLVGYGNRQDAVVLNDEERLSIDLGRCEFEISLGIQQVVAYVSDFYNDAAMEKFKQSRVFISLCKEVQLYECLSFLDLSMSLHKLYLSPGKKTRLVLKQCLETFSVAQTYNFIWRGVKDAAAYYMRSSIVKKHAANSAISNISRNYERALAYEWDVKPFHRNPDLPQSSLSQIIFNMVLGTDDGGFEHPLHELIEM